MVGLVERRLSKSAVWCRRLAIFAMLFFGLTILLHRIGNIDANQTIGLLAFGFILLIISILLAFNAIAHLWNEGAKGGKLMISGLSMSILMLIPFLIFAVFAVRYPSLNDVATNLYSPPQFSQKTRVQRKQTGVPINNNLPSSYDDGEITAILDAYPKLSSRRYPAGPERVFRAVDVIVEDRGWYITDVRGVAKEIDAPVPVLEGGKKKKKKKKPAKNKKANTSEPDPQSGLETAKVEDIYLDAVASSLVFGFRNDVVIKITEEGENTLVEMRSAARWGVHDFGENARIILKFMADLDQNLLGIAGEG